jgi:hypothetical protein
MSEDSSPAPSEERPEWWVENEELREFLGLPEYTPPRFADGVHTHDVIPELEERYGCDIRPLGINTRYLEEWELRIDNEFAFMISRHRDENGNTVYEITSDEFRKRVELWFGEHEKQ